MIDRLIAWIMGKTVINKANLSPSICHPPPVKAKLSPYNCCLFCLFVYSCCFVCRSNGRRDERAAAQHGLHATCAARARQHLCLRDDICGQRARAVATSAAQHLRQSARAAAANASLAQQRHVAELRQAEMRRRVAK